MGGSSGNVSARSGYGFLKIMKNSENMKVLESRPLSELSVLLALRRSFRRVAECEKRVFRYISLGCLSWIVRHLAADAWSPCRYLGGPLSIPGRAILIDQARPGRMADRPVLPSRRHAMLH